MRGKVYGPGRGGGYGGSVLHLQQGEVLGKSNIGPQIGKSIFMVPLRIPSKTLPTGQLDLIEGQIPT